MTHSRIINMILVGIFNLKVNLSLNYHIFRLTLLLGVIGNLLILVAILGYKKMKSPTNVFLASLAMADLLLCLICIPVKVRN